MRTRFIVGVWLILITLVIVRICNAETETQLINRTKNQNSADYKGKITVIENDGEVLKKEIIFYQKKDFKGDKFLVPLKFSYCVCSDGKAYRRAK